MISRFDIYDMEMPLKAAFGEAYRNHTIDFPEFGQPKPDAVHISLWYTPDTGNVSFTVGDSQFFEMPED